MIVRVHAAFAYRFAESTDVLLQLEAAADAAGQTLLSAALDLGDHAESGRVAAEDGVGERFWLRASGRLAVDYRATVRIDRAAPDLASLAAVPLHRLPASVVPYLMASRYCPSDLFENMVHDDFAGLTGGAAVAGMRDWIAAHFTYRCDSTAATTALDSYVARAGVCRDYAHVLVTLARAAGIPARFASVYAPRVDPPDFHAVAQVYLDGGWQLVDATGMATADEIAVIGVGRDAADVSFLTSYGHADFETQRVAVTALDPGAAG